MAQLRLKLLGAPEVYLDGQALDVGLKSTVLLGLLALAQSGLDQPERALTRDQLAQWLWGNRSNPLGNLSSALNKLREVLGKDAFETDERTRTLRLNLTVECDTIEVLHNANTDDPMRWDRAWSSLSDVFLAFPDPRWDARLEPEFQEWLNEHREALHQARRGLAGRLALHHLERQGWAQALGYLEAVPPEVGDPREQFAFYTMLVYTAQNQPDQAVRVYQCLADALAELGGHPSADAVAALEIARAFEIAAARGLLEELFPVGREVTDVPFVGRKFELERAASSLPLSLEARSHAIVLTGEPGAGKTEFARRLLRRLDPARRAYLIAEGFGERHAPAWRAFDLVVRQLVRARRHELDAMGSELRVALARFVPDLLEGATNPGAIEDERLLFLAIRWLLTHPERPTLLFLDDLQWIDVPSLGLVLELLRKPPPRGLVLLGTHRDTEPSSAGTNAEHGVGAPLERLFEMIRRQRLGLELTLEPLDAEAIAELAVGLGRRADATWMRDQSGGNPLYLLEMFDAAYLEPGAIPPKLEALVRARVNALPISSHARDVLDVCAVLGEGAGLAEVRAVAGLPYEETVGALGALREARLLRRGDAQVSFNHDLTAQVSLQVIAPERAQLLNLRAAQVRRHRPELAATHYWAALGEGRETLAVEEMREVADAFGRAAMMQSLRGDPEGGAAWFARTLDLAPDATARAMALTRRARVHERMLRYDQASDDLNQAERLSGAVDAVTRAGVLNAQGLLMATCFGDHQGAERVSNDALATLEGLRGSEVLSERANALSNLGVAAWQRHDLETAERHHREALDLRRGLNELERAAMSLQNLGLVFISKRDPTARAFFEEALALLEKMGNRMQIADAYTNLGWLEWQLGTLDEAERAFERAIAAGEPWGEDFNAHFIYNNIGAVRFLQGKYRQAREAYLVAFHSRHVTHHGLNKAIYLGNLAEVGLRLRLLGEVKAHLAQAFELLADRPNLALEADLHYFDGDGLALGGDFEAARAAFSNALERARRVGKPEREAESLARLARLDGDAGTAQQALRLARTPMLDASLRAVEGDPEGAVGALEAAGDWYEAGRLSLDLWHTTGLAPWRERAETCFQRV